MKSKHSCQTCHHWAQQDAKTGVCTALEHGNEAVVKIRILERSTMLINGGPVSVDVFAELETSLADYRAELITPADFRCASWQKAINGGRTTFMRKETE